MDDMMTPSTNFCAAVVDNRALVMDEIKADVEYLEITEAYCKSILFAVRKNIKISGLFSHIFESTFLIWLSISLACTVHIR